jgi:hypothetical protein
MKKIALLATLLSMIQLSVNAQIEIAKLIGKNSADYKTGFGGFLKFGYPVSDAADVNLEVGAMFFFEKQNSASGIAFLPVKLGYRYTLNGSGTGFYAEPQAGFNAYGVNSHDVDGYNVDDKFHGIVLGVGTGYLFPSFSGVQFDLGLRYETVLYKGNSVNFVGLRLSHNFSFRKRDNE